MPEQETLEEWDLDKLPPVDQDLREVSNPDALSEAEEDLNPLSTQKPVEAEKA